MSSYRPDKRDYGKVLNLGDIGGIGINTSISFQPGKGMLVIKTIPEKIMNAIIEDNLIDKNIWQKGKLIGNTQKHWLPIARMPISLYNKWKMELGDPKHDEVAAKKWRERWNSSEFAKLRTSEYKI